MKKVYCLDCDRAITIHGSAKIGDVIACDYCEAEFEIVKTNPPEIDWLYDDEWDDDEYDDDDYDDDE